MAYSSSDEDIAAPSRGIGKSGVNLFDDDLTTGTTAFEKRRLAWEKRKQERERQNQRQRERRNNGNTGGDNDSNDDDDESADLLAAESPLASPSPPQSPLYGRRSRNNNSRMNNIPRYNAKERSSSPLVTYNGDTATSKKQRRSPSALRNNNHSSRRFRDSPSPSPSPNRVSFAATTMKKNNQSQHQNIQRNSSNTATSRLKPTWNDSDSDDDIMKINLKEKMRSNNNNFRDNDFDNRPKSILSQPAKKDPTKKKFNYASSSDDDDFGEKMKAKLLEMKKKEQILQGVKSNTTSTTKAAAAARSTTQPIPSIKATAKALPVGPSSPFKSQSYNTKKRRGRLHHLQESSSDDDENFVDDMSSKLRARKQAELDAKYNRRNPIHHERRQREEFEKRQQQFGSGLEGTTILVDGTDQKSVSDMGEDNRRRGVASPGDGGWKQSRRRSPGQLKRDKDDDSSSNKRQRILMESDDEDGLWDDVNDDIQNSSDEDNDGDKKPRARGRGRPKGGAKKKEAAGATQQTQKRRRGRGAPKLDNQDDETMPTKRKAKSKKNAASKQQNVSRFASLLQDSDNDDDNDGNSISEQDKEDMKRDLKPTFANPKLGPPSALVPFVLSKSWKPGDPITNQEEDDNEESDKDDVDQVPASINRYLFPYQREGVQFMYKCVIHGKGCVLGELETDVLTFSHCYAFSFSYSKYLPIFSWCR